MNDNNRFNINEEIEKQFQRLFQYWADAEGVMKLFDTLKNAPFGPSIKELRYSGRQLVDGLRLKSTQAPDLSKVLIHITEAAENARKAFHDAVDSLIGFLHEEIDELVSKASLPVVATGFPQYTQLKQKMREVSRLIVQSRQERVQLDDLYIQIFKEHLKEIADLYDKMCISADVIAAMRRKEKGQFWIGTIVFGLLWAALAAIVIEIIKYLG